MKRLIFVLAFFFTEETASVVLIEATPLIDHKIRLFQF
jgi:hypothetical protein